MSLGLGPIHHLAILVADLAGAEAFYCGVLGFRIERRWAEKDGTTRSIWLKVGNDALLMLEKAEPKAARRAEGGGGWHMLAFTIDATDRARLEAKLAKRGIAIEGRTDYTLYFRDPEGNRLALSHWPHPVPQRP